MMAIIIDQDGKEILEYLYQNPYNYMTIRVPFEVTLDAVANATHQGDQRSFGASVYQLAEDGLIALATAEVNGLPGRFVRCKLTNQGRAMARILNPQFVSEESPCSFSIPLYMARVDGDHLIIDTGDPLKELIERLRYGPRGEDGIIRPYP